MGKLRVLKIPNSQYYFNINQIKNCLNINIKNKIDKLSREQVVKEIDDIILGIDNTIGKGYNLVKKVKNETL